MKKKLFYLLLILITFFIFVLLFKSIFLSNSYLPSTMINKKIQKFSGPDLYLNSETYIENLVSEKKYTIINIWASWCVPCRSEHIYLMKLKDHPNINLIGLNYKDNPEKAKIFINNFGNPFSNIIKDIDGTISIELGAYGVPETFIINDELRIIKKYIGELTPVNYEEIINIVKK